MGPVIHRISAWDGLTLHVREWRGDPASSPVLALPGLVRTGADFEDLAEVLGRRMISLDYMGRGDSARARDPRRYGPEACVRDILDVAAALHLHRAVVIGTSFGGLLSMGIAAARPGLVRAVVLNDIGPEVGTEGSDFVRDFVGFDPALPDLGACAAFLREKLPPMSLEDDAAWHRMADLTYRLGPDDRFHPRWDTRIARLLDGPVPDLWALWSALAHARLLVVRGEVSNILLPATLDRMRRDRPDMEVVTLPGIGHAPTLTEPPALAAIMAFLDVCR